MFAVIEAVWAWSEEAPPDLPYNHGQVTRTAQATPPIVSGQLMSGDPLSPATLQPLTPVTLPQAPGSPGLVTATALLCPAGTTPCVCLHPGPCGYSRLACIQIILCSGHLDPMGYTIVPTVLGWEHFCCDEMAMFSLGDR